MDEPDPAPVFIKQIPNETAKELLTKQDRIQRASYRLLLGLAYQKKYKPGYAAIQHKEQYGTYPPTWWGKGAVLGDNPTQQDQLAYVQYLEELAEKHGHDQAWINQYLALEFGSTGLASFAQSLSQAFSLSR